MPISIRLSRLASMPLSAKTEATLREIHERCSNTYCRNIGAEFTHIVDTEQRKWFQQRLESVHGRPVISAEAKAICLSVLTAAEGLGKIPGHQVPGHQAFRLEGGESLIPLLDEIDSAYRFLRRQGNRHRHGPPWPPERAGQYLRQESSRALRRV